jgi:hypothetical protein
VPTQLADLFSGSDFPKADSVVTAGRRQASALPTDRPGRCARLTGCWHACCGRSLGPHYHPPDPDSVLSWMQQVYQVRNDPLQRHNIPGS